MHLLGLHKTGPRRTSDKIGDASSLRSTEFSTAGQYNAELERQ